MMDPKYRLVMYATLIMITVMLCMEMAWGCVDCDLNKKAFEKNIKVVSVEGDIDTINCTILTFKNLNIILYLLTIKKSIGDFVFNY